MKKFFLILATAMVAAFTFASCSKNDPETPGEPDNSDMPSDKLACAFIDCAMAAMDFYYDGTVKATNDYTTFYRYEPAKTWIEVFITGSTIRMRYTSYLLVNSLQDYQNGNHGKSEQYTFDDYIFVDNHLDIPEDTYNTVIEYLKKNSHVSNVSVPYSFIIDVSLK